MKRNLYRIGVFLNLQIKNDPNGSRTRVAAVKGRCPRPLDDGVIKTNSFGALLYSFFTTCQDISFFWCKLKLKVNKVQNIKFYSSDHIYSLLQVDQLKTAQNNSVIWISFPCYKIAQV